MCPVCRNNRGADSARNLISDQGIHIEERLLHSNVAGVFRGRLTVYTKSLNL
jgi:hypothetical protein